MVAPKKIVEVKNNNKGTVTHVRLEGNNVVTRKKDGTEYHRLGKDVSVYSEDVNNNAEPATTSTPNEPIKENQKKMM